MGRKVLRAMEIDYYGVLQVSPSASSDEIRMSFKRLVIESHPDKNPQRRAWSERRVRELIRAYEILGDPLTREEFDRKRTIILKAKAKRGGPLRRSRPYYFYRSDPESRAQRVLYFLLHGDSGAALDLLFKLETQLGHDFLSRNLDRTDYLDCLFLLAEQFVARKEYSEAVRRLRSFYVHEAEVRFPRHYLDQVIQMLKDLYLRKLPRAGTSEEALDGLREAASLGLSKAEEIIRIQKMAEMLMALGRSREVDTMFSQAASGLLSSVELERIRSSLPAVAQRA